MKKYIDGQEYGVGNTNTIIDGHEYVDLGLRSKLLWATMNIGAIQIYGLGEMYQWGDICATWNRTNATWPNYRFVSKTNLNNLVDDFRSHMAVMALFQEPTSSTIESDDSFVQMAYAREEIFKYTLKEKHSLRLRRSFLSGSDRRLPDNKRQLELEDDAAHNKWLGRWRMPTKSDFEDLIRECDWNWQTIKDIPGALVTGPNGNKLFLPAENYGKIEYWSSTLGDDETDAFYLWAGSEFVKVNQISRTSPFRIRPVCKK